MNRLWLNNFSFILALLSTIGAFAADCRNPQTQTELNQCGAQDLEQLTKEINKVYAEYRGKLFKQMEPLLTTDQGSSISVDKVSRPRLQV